MRPEAPPDAAGGPGMDFGARAKSQKRKRKARFVHMRARRQWRR